LQRESLAKKLRKREDGERRRGGGEEGREGREMLSGRIFAVGTWGDGERRDTKGRRERERKREGRERERQERERERDGTDRWSSSPSFPTD